MHTTAMVVGLAAALWTAPLAAQSPQATVQRAVKAYAKIETIRASFTQSITNPLTGNDVESRGEMQQRIPGRLSIAFTEPAGDRIVANGQTVWLYLPSTTPGQVIRAHLAEGTRANVPDVTSWFLDSPEKRYTMTDAGTARVAGHATHAVALVAVDSTIPFRKATVWIDDDDALIRQFQTTDANGLTRRITITAIHPNAKLEPGVFDFTPPSGVRVIDQ